MARGSSGTVVSARSWARPQSAHHHMASGCRGPGPASEASGKGSAAGCAPRSRTISPLVDRHPRQVWKSAVDMARGEVAPRAGGLVTRAEGVDRQRPGDCEIRVVVAHREVLGGVVGSVDAVTDVGDVAEHL